MDMNMIRVDNQRIINVFSSQSSGSRSQVDALPGLNLDPISWELLDLELSETVQEESH